MNSGVSADNTPTITSAIQNSPIEIVGDKITIRNIRDIPRLPSYYVEDPDANLRNLGNITAEGFVPIHNWILGTPHKYGSMNEVNHDFDWSEFEGYHATDDICSIRDAYARGVDWCNKNLQCAKVFGAIYTQQPIIYPNHPEHSKFMEQFRDSYWDLLRVVPGLGDFGRVLAHPFGSNPNEEEEVREAYSNRGELNAVYGMDNPPHPNKVFYEILKYGAITIQRNLEMYKAACPELNFEIKAKACLQDIYLMASLLPQVQSACQIPPNVVKYFELELYENYGIAWSDDNPLITGAEYEDEDDYDDDAEYMTGFEPYRDDIAYLAEGVC